MGQTDTDNDPPRQAQPHRAEGGGGQLSMAMTLPRWVPTTCRCRAVVHSTANMDRPRRVSPENAITLQAGARRARDTSWGASHRRAHDHRSGDEGDLRHALQHDRGDPWALEHIPNPRCYVLHERALAICSGDASRSPANVRMLTRNVTRSSTRTSLGSNARKRAPPGRNR
jgi:hypothetical protein